MRFRRYEEQLNTTTKSDAHRALVEQKLKSILEVLPQLQYAQ